VRALGNLKETGGKPIAALQVPEIMIAAVELGQPAAVDTRIGVVPGRVYRIHSRGIKGVVRVDVILEGELPEGAVNGLSVDGTIEVGRLDDVLYIGRPVNGVQDSNLSLFKLAEDGLTATRVDVRLGKASVNSIQVVSGLKEGDRVIISNMSAYGDTNKIVFK